MSIQRGAVHPAILSFTPVIVVLASMLHCSGFIVDSLMTSVQVSRYMVSFIEVPGRRVMELCENLD